ncbi:phage tail length tape measure family protein [Aureimonas sp. SK2]|uniref:phage tail length tape measure family protein n=1 Tax=Aureimonas sp. SK2 TaxID=3015992 RepID=UPI002444A081|nr:phage tail length tape measure family protein [Aureimonas sp. SK2]
MAVTETRIEELVFRGKAEGIDQTKTALDGLAAAHARAGQAAGENARVYEEAGRSIRNPTAAFQELQKRLEGSPAAWKALERGLRVVSRAADDGKSDVAALDGAVDNLLRTFQRAVAPKLSPDVDLSPMKAAIGAAKSFDDQTRAMLRGMLKQAEESQEALRAQAKAAEDLAQRTARFRAELDPLTAAQAKLNAELAEAQALRVAGAITDDEVILRTQQLNKEYDNTSRRLTTANDNIRLTQDQMKNLGYQTNDLLTMWAMGASPFQIISSQAGQIVQALQDGPGGVRGSLKAIGTTMMGLMTPTTLVMGALGAAALAARYFGNDTAANLEKAEKAANSYAASIRTLQTAQGDLGSVMGRIFDREMIRSTEDARRQLALLAKEQVAARAALADTLVDAGKPGMLETLNPFGPMRELFRMGQGETNRGTFGYLGAEFEAGRRSAQSLREEVERILLDKQLPDDLREIGERMRDGARQAEEVEARIKAITNAIREQKREIANDNYRKAVDAFDRFLPDNRTERQKIEQAYRERVAAIRSLDDNPRAIEGRMNTAEAQRLAALKEIERQEEVLRQGRELDVQGITARTVAERALLAAQRERLALSEPGANREEIERRAAAASVMVYAQAESEAAEALRQARIGREQAGLDGYAAEVAAVNAQYAEQIRLAEGSEAAVRDLTEARNLELETLDATVRRSLFSAQEEEMRRLQAEIGLIGLNDDARREALATLQAEMELRRQGIDLNSAWGQSYVENARQIASMETVLDRQTEAFDDLREAAGSFFSSLSSGKGILETFVGAFAQLGNRLAQKGFDQIFAGLFGTGGQGGSTVAQATGAIGQLLSAPSRSSSVERTFAAPVGRVDRAPLAPVTVSLPATASTTVARAGNAFLDLIRRAEGTAGANGYNTSLAYGRFTGGERNLTGMTLNQIDALQTSMLRHPGNTYNSSALGAYQIVRTTLRGLREELGLDGSQLYSPELQDRLALTLAQRRGASASGLRNEWEGFRRVGEGEILGAYRAGVLGQNTASSTNDTRVIRKGTSEGVVDAQRRLGNIPVPTSRPTIRTDAAGNATGWNGFSQAGSILGVQYPGFSAMGGLSAGLGGFSAGYQGGSPVMGGLQGALGGFMAGGPIGGLIGLAAGALGGVLGGRAQRKAAHQQAADKWAEVQPQYQAFKKSLSGEETGNLRAFMSERWNTLRGFIDVGSKAWKMGSGNSSAEWSDTFIKISEAWHKEIDKFREGFAPALESLASGLGIDNAFSKGRDAAAQLKTKVQQFVDDVKVAYGEAWMGTGDVVDPRYSAEYDAIEERTRSEREENVRKAKEASREYALSMLFTDKTVSDVGNALQGLRGTAAGLVSVLVELGDTSLKAAADINDRLTQAIDRVRKTFVEDIKARINDLSGVGYLNDVAELLKVRDTMLADAALLNEDPSLVMDWFKLAAQDIVNGSELTGSAFDALVAKFPELAGVVKSFSEAVTVTTEQVQENYQAFLESRLTELTAARADAEAKLQSAYQRTVDWVKSLREFVSGMNLSDTSPLSGKAKVDAAAASFRDVAALAASGDPEAQQKLLGVSQEYLDAARDYYASSEAFYRVFDEVQGTLKSADAKASAELAYMKTQASFLEAIDDNTKSLATLMGEWIAAEKAEKELQKQVDGNRTFGANPERNRAIDAGIRQLGLRYTGNYGFQADGSDPFRSWRESLPAEQLAAVIGVIQQYIGINRAGGGLITGPGTSTSDSVPVNASNGEYMLRAAAVAALGVSTLDEINRTGRLPAVVVPERARPLRAANSGSAADMQLQSELRRLGDIVYASGQETRERIEKTNQLLGKVKQALDLAA